MKNKQVLIDSLPEGKLLENNYKLVESEMPKASSEEIIVKTISFAITAGTRAGLQGSASYAGAPTTGIVMNCTGIGEIIESNDNDYPVGRNVLTQTGWQEYSVQRPESLTLLREGIDPSLYLGPLGINGLTAYFGLLEEYHYKKLGGYLLSNAIKKSFEQKDIKRVWVHTCSLDNKNALLNYLSRGMKIYKSETLMR